MATLRIHMVCSNCGATNPAASKFCSECGTPLSQNCAACGSPLASGARFCSNCGTPTSAATGSVIPRTAPATPAPASGNGAAVAERRLVSVLFADLVGFTTLAEGRDAEETRDLLSGYFEQSRTIIERYGGTVEKFIGDAVMAVWGAPIARENDAERAVRAALDLVGTIPSLGPGLQARAGVLTGEAAVTLGATNQGMVAGDLVNTASRLQSIAPPGTVLVGESTERSASSAIVFEPVGDQVLKGKEAPVPAYRALRVVAERGGRGRSDRIEAPFVGRDNEFRLIKELVHATGKDRRARLVSITGVAGIGKSRLAWELNKYLDGIAERILWHAGRSPAYGEGITFWALGEMVRGRVGLLETDDEHTTRRKISAAVARWVPVESERSWIEGALLALLGFDTAATPSREELFSAWRTFFERIADTGTAILVFEDIHWADPGLLDFIDHILEWSRSVPILIVTLARPELLERRPTWGAGRRNFVALDLEPISDASMRELLEGLVTGLPEPVVKAIVARADGIPLYAVETVRMLVAEGRLAEVDGRYRPVAEIEALAVPETLQELIAARLDSLETADRTVLQDAAVLGQSFTVGALAAVSGLDAAAVEGRLRTLVRRELVVLDTDPRSPEHGQYAFVQALIREVAYGTLSKRDRRSRHLAAARYFESLGEEEIAGALAAHYLAAYRTSCGDDEAQALAAQARIALKAAAARAASLGSYEQAASYLVEAIEVTSDHAEAADLLERAGAAFGQAAEIDAAETHLRRAIAQRRESGDNLGAARAIGILGQALGNGYRRREAIELLRPAVEEFAGLGDDPALAFLEHELARSQWLLGDGEGAIWLADRALARAERIDAVAQIADTMVSKGSIIAEGGRYHEGFALLEAGNRLAEELGLANTQARALLNIGASSFGRDPVLALDYARRALSLARRLGLRAQLDVAAGNALEAAARVGEWDWVEIEGRQILDQEVAEAQRQSVLRGIEEVRAFRGEPVDDLLDEHRRLVEGGENTAVSNYHGALAPARLAEGRFADAAADWVRSAELNATNEATDLPKAARAWLWAGNRAEMERVARQFVDLRAHGPASAASVTTMRAATAGLDGRRDESLALYADALAKWSAAGLPIDRAMAAIDMIFVLGPDEAAARTAAEEARATFEELRAEKLIAILDRALAGGSVGPTEAPRGAGAPARAAGSEPRTA
ncbi:MAG TPA: adenylate/guanylate cyclase domain-containing protein [Candidatus Limnocylindrales bacterium]|nr:adenylate/guanylate cyclase domain-containing protein [Candidatus Limnocylindrales bacterium]